MPVHAPYNFVPLSSTVVEVPDPDLVSHDVPFSDGIGGWIDLELTAHTPLCVGLEREPDEKRGPLVRFFRTIDGELAVPGSSVRGMLRAVVEIAGFGKMKLVNQRRRYAVRDLQNNKLYTKYMTRRAGRKGKRAIYESTTLTGYLQRRDGRTQIVPCRMARVEHSDLIEYLKKTGRMSQAKAFERVIGKRSSSKEKYNAWGRDRRLRFQIPDERDHLMSNGNGYLRFDKAEALGLAGNDSIEGEIVLTGQAGRKHREFVFHTPDEAHALPVPDDVMRDFEANHGRDQGERHGGQAKPNDEWGYWKQTFEKGGRVPVFYLKDKEGRVESFGLAQMYRLAYKHTVGDAVRNSSAAHLGGKTDFAEALFGRAGDEHPLGRRVALGLFRAEGSPGTREHGPTVQGAPKPTYYPTYIEQEIPKGEDRLPKGRQYKTFMDQGVRIRGWKRYPSRPETTVPAPPEKSKPTTWTRFETVDAGARFRGRARVHNLRPVELGALLWALDFGGRPDLRHALGFGKAMGFGAVSLRIAAAGLRRLADGAEADLAEARSAFEAYMARALGRPLDETDAVILLRAMADPANAERHELRHMKLKNPNEFVKAKKDGYVLAAYEDVKAIRTRLRKRRSTKKREQEATYRRR